MGSWENLRAKLGLDDHKKCYWIPIIDTVPGAWKETF